MPKPQYYYRSTPQTSVSARDVPTLIYQLPEKCPVQLAAYAFDQEFENALSAFPPAPKNTKFTAAAFGSLSAFTPTGATQSSANAILSSYSQVSASGAGLVRYSARFNIVPASYDSFETYNVNFPGWLNTIGTNFRDPLPKLVTVRRRHDFFVIDPSGVLTGAGVKDSGGTDISLVASEGVIPILRRTPFLATYSGSALPNDEARSLVPAAGVGAYEPTLPSLEQYQDWCGIATTFLAAIISGGAQAWDATHPPVWNGSSDTDVLSGQFRLENSILNDYAGNIIDRVTTYAMAE